MPASLDADGDDPYNPYDYLSREHHSLIELPELEVETGQLPIPPDERAVIEAEAPMMAGPVEDVAEDRSWLSHKLLNIRTIVSFALAIGIIIFIFTRLEIDPAAIWSTMLTADPLFLLAGFVIYYSAFWLRAARWKLLLSNVGFSKEKKVNIPNKNGLVEIIYLSWFVNCIVPAKLGDAYRSYLLKRNSGISFSSTIGTILAERMIDLLVLFGLLIASFTLVQQQLSSSKDFPLGLVMLLGAMMVLALVVALVGLRFFSHLLVRLVPHRFREKFTSFRQGILRSFKRRSLPLLLLYTVLIWLFEAGRLFFVTRSLDAHTVTLSAVIFIALLSSLITTLPLTPGGAGFVEGAVTVALYLFLEDHELAFSIAILDRLINYWSLILGGLILYLISRRR
ncbi:MAG TPA: lysylphosphatidylglycerol synthase transmembrane domain-containing protein [Chloroflexia bacterium]|nr:lysylphosphatidylglycerol synthase transmembrane domain-containing protein [Chloroflexia bacterium]